MVTYGLHITQTNDPLQTISLSLLLKKIKHPKAEFKARIEQLRRMNEIDPNQYKQLKRGLPYFCCSTFNPNYRKKENFSSVRVFTLDLDHFSESDLTKREVFDKLQVDENIRFLFTTPSGDGLKAVFELDQVCKDAGVYSHFYKTFAQKFALKHNLTSVIDWVTHDVTRAVFLSADEEAWENINAKKIKIEDYISEDFNQDYTLFEKGFDTLVKEAPLSHKTTKGSNLEENILIAIKQKINPNYKTKKQKEIFVPEHLNDILPILETELSKQNIKIIKINSINYGKQIRVAHKNIWAEVNVFYGKRGFSVVRTMKTGSHKELGELTFQIIDKYLNEDTALE